MSQPPLRLGSLSFLNVLPLEMNLRRDPALYRPFPGVPSTLNRMVRQGELDVSLVSSVEYATNHHLYHILPNLSISAPDEVGSVLLFSGRTLAELSGGTIEAPFESETSVALLTLLLHRSWEVEAGLLPEGQVENPDAVLRIGDRALTERASGRHAHVWDMGREWRSWTGLPFVFALWVVRREAVEERPEQVARLHRTLLEAKRAGQANLLAAARQAARILGGEVETYLDYYRGLSYDLGPEACSGLARFFSLLYEEGLISRPAPLDFLPSGEAEGQSGLAGAGLA